MTLQRSCDGLRSAKVRVLVHVFMLRCVQCVGKELKVFSSYYLDRVGAPVEEAQADPSFQQTHNTVYVVCFLRTSGSSVI